MQKGLSLRDAARLAKGADTEEQHDSSEECGKRQSDRIACARMECSKVPYCVAEEKNREENENAADGLVPDHASGPHDLRHNVGRELSRVFDLNGLGKFDSVSELQFTYLAVYLLQRKVHSVE